MDLHLFDKQVKYKGDKNLSLAWNSSEINFLLEKHKKKIRSKYVNAIYDIINKTSNNYNHFKFLGIDLIEMSLIKEKNPFKSSNIFDCLKLLVFEEFIKEKKIKNIFYHGKSFKIHKSLKYLCLKLNLNYFNQNLIINEFKFKSLYFLNGFLFFFIQILKNFKLTINFKKYSNITFFSYFVHFKSISGKKFKSNLWGELPKNLNDKRKNVNWFHFYVPSNQIKNSSKANKLKKKFNLNKYENHNFINSYLTIKDYFLCLFFFFTFYFKNILLFKKHINFFNNKYSQCNFYYFLQEDFFSSIFGTTMIYNLMNIRSLNNLLREIPKQKVGVYIIENQSWENCLIRFWRKYRHGKLIAYFNSSIRFWDLRYLKKKKRIQRFRKKSRSVFCQ